MLPSTRDVTFTYSACSVFRTRAVYGGDGPLPKVRTISWSRSGKVSGYCIVPNTTRICAPVTSASLSQEVGLALGAQAGEQRLTEVLNEGGFSRVRRAAETPFNIVLEARA